MPNAKTTTSELSVGLGLLGIEPANISIEQMDIGFAQTVSSKYFQQFRSEYQKNKEKNKYEDFYRLGMDMQRAYKPFALPRPAVVRWEGPAKQASTSSVACDLLAAGTAISVKYESDVVRNPSPWNLFVTLPRSESSEDNADNWFALQTIDKYQIAYEDARNRWWPELPVDVNTYDERPRGSTFWGKKALGKKIPSKGLDKSFPEFYKLYCDLCHEVARQSALAFNQNLAKSLASGKKISVVESLLRYFFRLEVHDYLLCGLEGTKPFCVLVPSLTEWKREWEFISLKAAPDLDRGQSVVDFIFEYRSKVDRTRFVSDFHAEVRWSHGKFCGNPEAKLYKGRRGAVWNWMELPFYETLIPAKSTPKNVLKPRKTLFVSSGGFADVWKAVNETGEPVALKEISAHKREPETVERFRLEAKIQSVLVHPNIIRVLSSDLESDDPWYTMPLANKDLGELIAQKALSRAEYFKVFYDILDAIEYAHMQGIVHRDLKPSNVLVFDNNVVEVADFGSSRNLHLSGQGITASGEFLGTVEYAAPEQLSNAKASDERTDIYALGTILFEIVSGTRYDISSGLGSLHDPVSSILVKCLASNPNNRYQNVGELRRAFDALK